MVKIITIVKNDPITGIEYGTIEVPETEIEISDKKYAAAYADAMARVQSVQTQKFRGNNTKNK